MSAPVQSCQPKAESLPERLRVGSCRYAHETQDDAAMRRIKTDLEAADRIEFLEFEWNRATEGMQERDTTIATLKAQVEQLESNAREQAKLLADTGRRVEEMADALRFAEKQSDVPNNDDDVLSWAAMLYSRMRDIHTIARAALSSGEAVK